MFPHFFVSFFWRGGLSYVGPPVSGGWSGIVSSHVLWPTCQGPTARPPGSVTAQALLMEGRHSRGKCRQKDGGVELSGGRREMRRQYQLLIASSDLTGDQGQGYMLAAFHSKIELNSHNAKWSCLLLAWRAHLPPTFDFEASLTCPRGARGVEAFLQ